MKNEKIRYFFLYKTTNKMNGKFYIGVHSTLKINDGYLGSGKRLRYSIRKYGKENFEIEILEFFDSKELMFEAEKNLVNIDLIKSELCMNLKEGGIGGWTKKQQIENAIKSNIKKRELRENNPEWRKLEKIRNSENMRKSYEYGNRDKKQPMDWTGKKHKKETIQKMKKSKNIGKLNSQYGTKWINKNGIVKKIKEIELEYYLDNGWTQGRKGDVADQVIALD
jgi:hypothetical protein